MLQDELRLCATPEHTHPQPAGVIQQRLTGAAAKTRWVGAVAEACRARSTSPLDCVCPLLCSGKAFERGSADGETGT